MRGTEPVHDGHQGFGKQSMHISATSAPSLNCDGSRTSNLRIIPNRSDRRPGRYSRTTHRAVTPAKVT